MLSDEQFAIFQEQNRAALEKQHDTLHKLSESMLEMERRLTAAEDRAVAEEAEAKARKKSDERQRMWRSTVLAILQSGCDPHGAPDSDDPAVAAAAIAQFADAIVAEDDKRVP